MNKAKEFDQFFTSDNVARDCLKYLADIAPQLGYNIFKDVHFLEPSAGGGAFLRALELQGLDKTGWDIDPKCEDVIANDFLNSDNPPLPEREIIVIGNPPFGKRSKLAINFINRALEFSDTVAFILPIQFNKYSAQSKINSKAKLVLNCMLPYISFIYCG